MRTDLLIKLLRSSRRGGSHRVVHWLPQPLLSPVLTAPHLYTILDRVSAAWARLETNSSTPVFVFLLQTFIPLRQHRTDLVVRPVLGHPRTAAGLRIQGRQQLCEHSTENLRKLAMRRLGVMLFVLPLLSALACNDATSPPVTAGRGIRVPRHTLVIPSTTPQISAGYVHTCALKTDGTVVCWGYDLFGQSTVPADLNSVGQVSAGGYHTCVVKSDGTVVCWGRNVEGQTTVPSGLTTVAQISAGGFHTCALKTDGTVACWGSNFAGQATVPGGLSAVVQVSAGDTHSCAVKTDGTVICWGDNDYGQATVPGGLAPVTQMSSAMIHSCALKADATVVCWGQNPNGQTTVPSGLVTVASVSAGPAHTCALKTDATVVCWGDNTYGGTTVPSGLASVQVAVGYFHTCALKANGTIACWGEQNTSYSFGQATVPAGLNLLGSGDNEAILHWPLHSDGPLTAPVATVFDHKMTRPYKYDGELVATNNLTALRNAGIMGEKPECYRTTNGQNTTLQQVMNYVGPSDCRTPDYLSYDDHPGIDYSYCVLTPIYAPANGTVRYDLNGPEGKASDYNSLTVVLPSGWRIRFLHLNSFYDEKTKTVRRIPAAGCGSNKDLKAAPSVPCPECAKPFEEITISRSDPIGYSGDFSKKRGGVSAHLHIEVLDPTGRPRDPYGWNGAPATDPYVTSNGNLWFK